MKNAWEAVRAVRLTRGGETIAKPDVLAAMGRVPLDALLRGTLNDIRDFYLGGVPGFPRDVDERSFRGALRAFTLALIHQFMEKAAS